MSIVASSVSPLRTPVSRHTKVARPDVDPTPSGSILVSDIIYRISSICDGPAVCDHPVDQVFVFLKPNGDSTTVAVPIAGLTANGRASDPIGQCKACLLPAGR